VGVGGTALRDDRVAGVGAGGGRTTLPDAPSRAGPGAVRGGAAAGRLAGLNEPRQVG